MSDANQPSLDKAARKIVDSTLAIAIARFFVPIALAVIGWFMTTAITDLKEQIRDGNAAIWTAVKTVQTTVNQQTTDIAVMKQGNASTERAIDRLTTIVDKLNAKP
jgi:hypothetical protein